MEKQRLIQIIFEHVIGHQNTIDLWSGKAHRSHTRACQQRREPGSAGRPPIGKPHETFNNAKLADKSLMVGCTWRKACQGITEIDTRASQRFGLGLQ